MITALGGPRNLRSSFLELPKAAAQREKCLTRKGRERSKLDLAQEVSLWAKDKGQEEIVVIERSLPTWHNAPTWAVCLFGVCVS